MFGRTLHMFSRTQKWMPLILVVSKLKAPPFCFHGAWTQRYLVTFKFWHVSGYVNTRRASRWVPVASTLFILCSYIPPSFLCFLPSFPLHPVFLQVSSHLQVLAKRKSREFQSKLKVHRRTDFAVLAALFCMSLKSY